MTTFKKSILSAIEFLAIAGSVTLFGLVMLDRPIAVGAALEPGQAGTNVSMVATTLVMSSTSFTNAPPNLRQRWVEDAFHAGFQAGLNASVAVVHGELTIAGAPAFFHNEFTNWATRAGHIP